MKIRLLQDHDIEALERLFFKTVRQVNIKDYSRSQVEAWAPENRDMEKWRQSFQRKTVFVLDDEGKIKGFGELEPNGHIDRFYIDSESIGQGLGKKIYTEIEKEAGKQMLSRLFTEASLTAKPFFERMGFQMMKKQMVSVRGVEMPNFVMEKFLK